MKICAFYQTFVPIPDSVYKKINRIIVSSFHFNKSCCGGPLLHLNDNIPYHPKFVSMWKQMESLYIKYGTEILINLGGAGGGLVEMFTVNYNKAILMIGKLVQNFPFIKGVVIDAEYQISLTNINMLISDLNLLELDVYFAPVFSAMLYPSSPGMGGFCYDKFQKSQALIKGFFVQCYVDDYFTGKTFTEIKSNFSGFQTLTPGILPGTVPLDELKDRVSALEDNGCREVYVWELGEAGAIDVINNL